MKKRRMWILLPVAAALGLLCAAFLCYWFNWPVASWRDYRVRRAIREAHSLRLVERFYFLPQTPEDIREPEVTTITDRAAIKRIGELLTFEKLGGRLMSAAPYSLILCDEQGEPLLEVRVKYEGYWIVEGFRVDRGPSVKLWEFLEKGDWRKSAGK